MLTVDTDRLGTETFIEKMTRAACIELMQFIPRYRASYLLLYTCDTFSGTLTDESFCSAGDLPAGARPTEAWVVRTSDVEDFDATVEYSENDVVRGLIEDAPLFRAMQDMSAGIDPQGLYGEVYWEELTTLPLLQAAQALNLDAGITTHPVLNTGWEQRMEALSGQMCVSDNNARLFISTQGSDFLIYPKLPGDDDVYAAFVLQYDTDTVPSVDATVVPYDEPMVYCVADYVKAELARHVDRDQAAFTSLMHSYQQKRRNLYLRAKELGRVND